MIYKALPVSVLLFAPSLQEPPDVSRPDAAVHADQKPNRLIHETSPYLLQHAYNPVDWYPWGEEALRRAREEDKPIFLSIGYSACHWCHVMERESFEDPEIAAYLNQHFVSIKVDREERPDLDELYMTAVQRMVGHGGWPMSVFLTGERKPFAGGTYFPPEPRQGMASFRQVLERVVDFWENRRGDVNQIAEQVGDSLKLELPPAPDTGLPAADHLAAMDRRWVEAFASDYDPEWGGFGPAPKFPHAADLRFLLAAADRSELPEAREMALFTLRKMASGGMYDQIGGGFARYSTDARWMIPHFEKMLYDQGTLIPAYLEAWRQSGDEFYAGIARQSCDYLLREMRDETGAFWSSTDADSEGVEGKFFVWTPAQLEEVLGESRARFAAELWGVTPSGNFEHGATALHRARTPAAAAAAAGIETEEPAELAEEVRAALYAARSERVPPGTDDKLILAWNGLAIEALAAAGRMLDEPRYTAAAAGAAEALLAHLRTEEGWRRSWRKNKAHNPAVLEDYAYLARGFLGLFQSTGDPRWLSEAEALAHVLLEDFWNPEAAVFWDVDGKDGTLLHRRMTPWDGATAAPNAVALECLVQLHAFTAEHAWRETAERGYLALLGMIDRSPRGFPATMRGLGGALLEPRVAVVIGTGGRESLEGWRRALFAPGSSAVLTVFRESADPDSPLGLFSGRAARQGKPTLYLCRGTTCLPPSHDPAELPEMLAD